MDPMEKAKQVAELEDTIRRRDDRIAELIQERDRERELNSELRERFEDAHAMIERWTEGFDMVRDDDGKWGWSEYHWQFEELLDRYEKLLKNWNAFVPGYNAIVAPTKRNRGRPIGVAPAQRADVLNRRKAGQSLHSIAADTGLGFQTVRTIIKKDGLDRSTEARLAKIAPDKLAESHKRANRKTRATLPARINKALKQGAELRKRLRRE